MRNTPKRGGRSASLPAHPIDRPSGLAHPSADHPAADPGAMRQEIESLRAEVKQLRATVEMLLSMVVDGERGGEPAETHSHEENLPFYN